MSRAAWAGLLFFGAGLGLIAFLLTRGLPDEVVEEAQRTRAQVEATEKQLATTRTQFESVVAEDPGYMKDLPSTKEGQKVLDERAAALAKAKARLDGEVADLLKEDDHGDRTKLLGALVDVRQAVSEAQTGLGEPEAQARRALRYKQDYPQIVKAARENIAAARTLPQDPQLETQYQLAITSYPEVKDKLQARFQQIGAHAQEIAKLGDRLETLASASPPDYAAVGATADAIGQGYDKLRKMKADLLESTAALSRSVDKILVDMKQEGSSYYHKYKIIENGQARETDWQPVTRQVYEQHEPHLGMAILSKPEGVLPEDATEVATPPGYNYVGNPRYGFWENRNGQSFWTFYGQYALMRDLMWGPGYYRPISRVDWDDFYDHKRKKKPWYGKQRQYGTSGSQTTTRYAGSRYVTQKRVAATRSSPSTPSSPRTGYSGSKYSGGSGSTRSGGYRSSGYRSSSFGGGGK